MSVNDSEFNINPNDSYYKAVKVVFDNWTALQLAITHSFAGSGTKETAEWFLNATYQWIIDNDDLEDTELEDFLCDTMDKEFNTILDDGSCLEIARLLLKYSSLYKNQKINELNEEIAKRYSKKSTNALQASKKFNNPDNNDESTSDEDDEEDENQDEPMDQETESSVQPKQKNLMSTEENENFEKVDEGWTFVTKTGKRVTK